MQEKNSVKPSFVPKISEPKTAGGRNDIRLVRNSDNIVEKAVNASYSENAMARNFSRILRNSGRATLLGDVLALCTAFMYGGVVAWLANMFLFTGGVVRLAELNMAKQLLIFTLAGALAIFWLDAKGHYRHRLPYWETVSHFLAVAICGLAASGIGQLLADRAFSQAWFASSWVLFAVFLFSVRGAVRRELDKRGMWKVPVVLIGNGPAAENVIHALAREPEMGFDIVEQIAPEHLRDMDAPVAWRRLLLACDACHIFLAMEAGDLERYKGALASLVRERLPFSIVPALTGLPTGTLSQHHFLLHDALLLHDTNRLYLAAPAVLKRSFDIFCSGFALFMLAPLFACVALLVRRDGGPAIFSQQRVGRGGRRFACYKFRSMRVDAEAYLTQYLSEHPEAAEEWKKFQKLKKDVRITPIGHFIRRTSIDELPQLINVFKGDMSLIGPRPIIPEQEEFYGADFVYYESVRPGITGPWQVSGRNKLTFSERVQLECSYARNWSLWMDIVILLKTVPALLKKDSAF